MRTEERIYALLGLGIAGLAAYFAYQQINQKLKTELEQTAIVRTIQSGYWGLPNDWFSRGCSTGPIEFKIKDKSLAWRRKATTNSAASTWQIEPMTDFDDNYLKVQASANSFLGPEKATDPREEPKAPSPEIYRLTSPTALSWATEGQDGNLKYVQCQS